MSNSNFKEPVLAYLDFEFNQIMKEEVNLVSCVVHDSKGISKKFWLHNSPTHQDNLRKYLGRYQYICGFACVAEARSFYALNLNPLSFKWIDLFLEYRMLTNHNDKLNWGQQLVDGKVKTFSKPKPKWERSEEDKKKGFKPTHSLAEATFKLTGQIRDTKEKDEVRQLIISNPKKFTEAERKRILDYNAADVEFLPVLWEAIKMQYESLVHSDYLDWEEYFEDALWRGRYSAHTAIMESVGYPINLKSTRNFSSQIPAIMAECQRDINSQFPKGQKPFKWHHKKGFSWNQTLTRDWIKTQPFAGGWMLTDTKQLSLSLEAFEKFFAFKHDYPRGNLGAQLVRYLKLKQSLYGFSLKKEGGKKSFWDNVGPDGRVRPYMNIYGAQSGRSQPAATGFMFLKPAWMRALVEPQPGKYLAGIDYGQQEFFLAGLLSEDQKMIDAYLSGDPYLFMGKEAGTIPRDGTRKSHERERDLMKSTTLGILFGMTKYGLAIKLTADSGQEFTEDEAQDLIDMFNEIFPRHHEWRQEQIDLYQEGYAISTLDGWKMWTDNDNPRSVQNVPVQGGGAAIMRKAVDLAVTKGCKVIFTLHDAIYIEGGRLYDDIAVLRDAMREAFSFYFEGTAVHKYAKHIKLDPKAWGPDFPDKGEIEVKGMKVPVSKLYIDGRAQADYDRFSNYFGGSDIDLL